MATHHKQHAILLHVRAKLSDDLIKKTVEIKNSICMLALAPDTWITGVAVAPVDTLHMMERIQLQEKEIPGFARKEFEAQARPAAPYTCRVPTEFAQLPRLWDAR